MGANANGPKRKWGRHCCRPHYRLCRFRASFWPASILRPMQSCYIRPAQPRRRVVPSGGRNCSRRSTSFHLAVPMGCSMFHLQDAVLANCAPCRFPSVAFVPLVAGLATCSGLCFRAFRPTWSLPIASRLSRHLRFAKACSEELAKLVFRRCCGHRCHPDQVEFFRSLSGG